ncbi:hypothetical protein ASG00_07520 [Microbacterium sp. Leaf351]|nr:hypothetical protein ASG00_07520 [Microbacterium sp. Leaf351]
MPPPGIVHPLRPPSFQWARSTLPSASVMTAYAATRMSMSEAYDPCSRGGLGGRAYTVRHA